MSSKDKELEVKFYLPGLARMETRLQELGATLQQPRGHEINLRFDLPDGSLTRALQVLRLRQDTAARVTYKGPGQVIGGVKVRQELEFTVSDFDTAKALFEALGYRVSVMYEKYRRVYVFEAVLVTLDEMPYGNFVEVEGSHSALIRAAAEKLDLNWSARILDSYLMLFDHLRGVMGLAFDDLSFANFEGVEVSPEMLGVRAAR
jgi:adenylate cyclase class 2